MSISLPPRPPELGDRVPVDQEALIEEARRRARRRRLRNLVGVLAAMLGALWLYSLLGGGGPESGTAFLTESSPPSAAALRAALPEQLAFNADGSIVLVHRDGTRRYLVRGIDRLRPHHFIRFYSGIEWSRNGSKLLALRWGSRRALVVIDANGKVGPAIARQALDGRLSPDGRRIAFVRRDPGVGRVLYVASSDGRNVTRVAAHLSIPGGGFSWSPDGTELVYAGQGSPGLFIADASGRSTPRPFPITAGPGTPVKEAGSPQWSPDGSLIAFTSADDSTNVIRPDGTSLRRVAGGAEQIVWSPESTRLALVGAGSWQDIAVVDADGTGFHVIARCACTLRGATGTSIAWSPDGSRIAYVSGRGNTVSTIRPDGSGATVVVAHAARSRGLLPGWPLWRPRSPR